jgi:uncharacterized protein (DUF3820 family)
MAGPASPPAPDGVPPPASTPDAATLECLLTHVMPFGKYAGRPIADLPAHYLNWFAKTGFPRGETGRLLALMHEIDHNGLRMLLDPLRRSLPRKR